MNWERAKTWLITAFFLLDLVLGWQVYQSRVEFLGYVESYDDLLANTKTLLAEHGLSLATSVPSIHPSMPSLHADFPNPSIAQLAQTAFRNAKTIEVNLREGTAQAPEGNLLLLGNGMWQVRYTKSPQIPPGGTVTAMPIIWHGSDFTLDQAASSTGTQVFTERYQNYPIFDAELIVSISNNTVTAYSQSALTNINAVGGVKPVITALDALNSLANTIDKSTGQTDNRILKIDLGYIRKVSVPPSNSPSPPSNYWFPVWRIVTDVHMYFVNALTGEVDISS